MIDAAGEVIVNGPVGPSTRKTSKSFVFKVSNDGTTPITITAADITAASCQQVETGSVSVAGLPVTIGPGSSKRLKARLELFRWIVRSGRHSRVQRMREPGW